MKNEPEDGVALLAAARALLESDLLPGLQGSQRHAARMVMRAMDIAMRELRFGLEPALAEAQGLTTLLGDPLASASIDEASLRRLEKATGEHNRLLVVMIRGGRLDPGEPKHAAAFEHLRAMTRLRLQVSNPRVLGAAPGEAAPAAAATMPP